MMLKNPHTAIFSGMTGCGKTKLFLNLIESHYNNHFDYIVVFCPTIKNNLSYGRNWIWNDDYVILFCVFDNFEDTLRDLRSWLSGCEVLFVLDDMICEKSLDKRRTETLKLAVSGRHDRHYLWILTQVYNAVPKDLRRQAKVVYLWYPKERGEFKSVMDENNVVDEKDFLNVFNRLKDGSCLCLNMEDKKYYFVR